MGNISPIEPYPRHWMYGIFTYIWLICMVNVGRYTIHWVSGYIMILQDDMWRSRQPWRHGKGRGNRVLGIFGPPNTNYPRSPKSYSKNCLKVNHVLHRPHGSECKEHWQHFLHPALGDPRKKAAWGSKICSTNLLYSSFSTGMKTCKNAWLMIWSSWSSHC